MLKLKNIYNLMNLHFVTSLCVCSIIILSVTSPKKVSWSCLVFKNYSKLDDLEMSIAVCICTTIQRLQNIYNNILCRMISRLCEVCSCLSVQRLLVMLSSLMFLL